MRVKHPVPSNIDPVIAFGVHDSNLRLIERMLEVKISPSENSIIIEGSDEAVTKTGIILNNLYKLTKGGQPVSYNEIKIMIDDGNKSANYNLQKLTTEGLVLSKKGNRLKPRSVHQADYIQNMLNYDLVFSIGPAGTGKTYLAVGLALHLLFIGRINKVILTRPVIEAGENLGFLPGTLEEKIDPYLRPLFDAINEMLSVNELKSLMENQIIELAPLAYMRGRTLANAFIILDEGQNTTNIQMKMFLTRLGENSKMVVTGDITQIDLPHGRESGLKNAIELFENVDGIKFNDFEQDDVVRHGLVRRIIDIYEKRENEVWKEIKAR